MADLDRSALPRRVYPDSERQADPVFLLQSREWVCLDRSAFTWDDAAEELRDANGVLVDEAYMEGSEDWEERWYTEGVFFTREEAKAWGAARAYRWEKHRTYAVSARGVLADLLAGLTTRDDGRPYRSKKGE